MNYQYRKYIRFTVVLLLYTLLVIWFRFYWLFVGVAFIFDYYITRIIPWKVLKIRTRMGNQFKDIFDWVSAIVVALCLVVTIRTFLIEAFTIPTPSMEKTLMVGDYLFVSKISYGPKLPNTPLAFPFTHNTLPFSKTRKSFSEKVQWPYKRLAGFLKIKRNDVVVFNFPEGDTVVAQFPDQNYYSLIRKYGRQTIINQYDILYRPVDKRDNFVKRCVALPGDTLEIRHSKTYVNHQLLKESQNIQYNYYVRTNGEKIFTEELENLDITGTDRLYDPSQESYILPLTSDLAEKMRNMANVYAVTKLENTNKKLSYLSFYPYNSRYQWTEDNFGPLIVPKRNMTIKLTLENLPLYSRIIDVYEQNKLAIIDSTIYINDQPQNTYTFTMDYYFMLGDNRHNSADSRIWGFVPENHIVGKAIFVWLSLDKDKRSFQKFRWEKMFKTIK